MQTPRPKLFLVVFEEAPAAGAEQPEKAAALDAGEEASESATDVDARIAALKQELRAKEEYLQTTNEELETSNEELKSSNEEMQSVNEELQSTNEELETSKEELQSVNEELATVNTELQNKVADLSRANNDMNNLLAGTGIGTIFVDHQLRIQRFTPAVTQVINLILTDVGRPVGHIVSNLVGYDRLVADVRAVLDTLVPKEVEVQTQAGAWYLLRIRPYRTLENVIEGRGDHLHRDHRDENGAGGAAGIRGPAPPGGGGARRARCHHGAGLGGSHPGLESGGGEDVRLERSRGAGDERPRPDPGGPAGGSVGRAPATEPG